MADKLQKMPVKGILKSSSFDTNEPVRSQKEMKWDEMNILQTLHPPDKDYGHMKISEPKTPFSYYKDTDDNDSHEPKSDDETDGLDANLLAQKIQLGSSEPPKVLADQDSEEDEEEFADESDEQRAKRKVFEQKRKLHYNEFHAVKLARKLMEQDDDDDEDDDSRDGDDAKPASSKKRAGSTGSHSSRTASSTDPAAPSSSSRQPSSAGSSSES